MKSRSLAGASWGLLALVLLTIASASAQVESTALPTEVLVTDSAGQPIAGATVMAVSEAVSPPGEALPTFLTDEQGRAEIPQGDAIQVTAPGYLTAIGVPAANIVLQRPSRLSVRVLDARSHERVPGASVTLVDRTDAPAPQKTDDEGRVILAGLQPGPVEVRVEAPGYLPGTSVAALAAEETRALSLRLRRSASLNGVVLAEGKPVLGALVRAVPAVSSRMARRQGGSGRGGARAGGRGAGRGRAAESGSWREPLLHLELTTDEKGRFVARDIPAARRSSALLVAVDEEGRWGVALVAGDKGFGDSAVPGGDATVSIDLGESQLVTGTVVWQDGSPAMGVPVVAEFSQEWVMPGGARRARFGVSLASLFEESGGGPSSLTDEEGAFSIRLPAGDWRLLSRPSGQAESEAVEVRVEDEAALPVELLLSRGRTLEGTIRDPNGNPVPSAAIVATSGRRWGGQRVDGEVDAEGRFFVSGIQEGRVTLIATASGFGETRVEVSEEASRDQRIVLRRTGTLRGRALSASSGEPLLHFTVTKRNLAQEEGRGRRWRGRNGSGEEFLTEDGQFEIREVAEGLWAVKISAPGYIGAASESVELRSGQTGDVGDVELYPGATIVGRVEDLDTKEALLGATVTLEGLSGGSRWGRRTQGGTGPADTTDAEGRFRLESVPPGDFTVKARHPDYPDSFEHATRVAIGDDGAGKEYEATLSLELGGTVAGLVLDASGEPVVGASVVAMDPKARGFAGVLREPVETGPDGSFLLEFLPPGRVELRRSDRIGVSSEVVVKKGEIVETTLRDEGLRVFGRVLVGGNVVRARVSLRTRSFAAPRSEWTETYELVGVPPGPWDVEVEIRELGSTAKARVERSSMVVPADVAEWERDFEFEEVDSSDDVVVQGRVVDIDTEEGLDGVTVFASKQGVPSVTARTKEGAFSLTIPEAGEWRLRVSTRGNPAKQYNAVPALTLVVEKGQLQSDPPSFAMQRRTDLDIRVLDLAGAPVEGARCYALSRAQNLSPDWGLSPRLAETTDALGLALVSAAKPGLHDLLIVATPARAFVIIEDVEIGSGDELDFVLPPSGSLLISAGGVERLELHGLPHGWWSLLAGPHGAGPLSRLGVIEQAGSSVKVNGLPAGEYTIKADGHDHVVEILPPAQGTLDLSENGL